jgi:molybdopterin/thiamine biosynthesis adenylyltransferase
MQKLDDVDMGTDDEEDMINTGEKKDKPKNKDIDIEDEAVKDRWSRYIGAMGIEAVKKQASANIFLSGAGGLGIEISKNIVLAGCKKFTLHDTQPISQKDLSAQFFLSENDKAATRGEACINRLSGLNSYVRTQCAASIPLPKDHAELEKEPWNLHEYQVVILTESDYETICAVNDFCHKKGIKFITCDAAGVFGRVFNDFTGEFEVLDKNGEELPDMMVKSISIEENGIVEIIPTAKHKFEDGDECAFTLIEGMKLKQGEKHEDPDLKSDGINDTIHKVKVISPYKFSIGDTRKYEKYEGNGIVK